MKRPEFEPDYIPEGIDIPRWILIILILLFMILISTCSCNRRIYPAWMSDKTEQNEKIISDSNNNPID